MISVLERETRSDLLKYDVAGGATNTIRPLTHPLDLPERRASVESIHEPASQEIWKPVVGFEGYYEVSSHGRVRSLDRRVPHAVYESQFIAGRTMQTSQLPKGYLQVTLSRGDLRQRPYVHHLAAEAFIGPRPQGMEVCHNNGDPADNRAANLRYDTPSANNREKRIHGTDHNVNRTHCPRGHALAEPNLVVRRFAETGHRLCRSCAAARAYVQRHAGADFHTEADRYYSRYAPTPIQEKS